LQHRLIDYEQKLALKIGELEDLKRQRNEYEETISTMDDLNQRLHLQVGCPLFFMRVLIVVFFNID
jgi:hypothetical protein